MALSDVVQQEITHWVTAMQNGGRVATRMPYGWLKGQLASRLSVADPSLGDPPASWDYELAPFGIRVADNAVVTSDELYTALVNESQGVSDFTDDLATGVGTVAHAAVATAGEAVAAAIGVSPVLLWGALAFGAYYVVTHVQETKRYVRAVVA